MSKKHRKQRVKIRRLNWDVEYYTDLMNGTGFQITEPSEVTIDGVRKKSLYGPQSPLYGTTYSDDQAFIERCRCECGAFKSRQFEGQECPICHTKVEERGVDINMTGWISLGTNFIINPYYYKVLTQTLGKSVFPDIVTAKNKVTTDGKIKKLTEDDYESKPSSPYVGIGINGFFADYENILNYFKSIKKNKVKTIDYLLKQKRAVFTSHIPIPSTALRPQSTTADTFYFGSVDKIINVLVSLSNSLQDCINVERDYILQRIQKKVNAMWDINLALLKGKDGFIRDQILGGSCNFTSRNVIVPAPDLKDNEVDISYQTFRELFKYKIIYYLMRLDDITLSKAYDIWKKSYVFDEKVYDIMEYILEKEDPKLLINRNPTLRKIWCH